jgi:hypothetical protein
LQKSYSSWRPHLRLGTLDVTETRLDQRYLRYPVLNRFNTAVCANTLASATAKVNSA